MKLRLGFVSNSSSASFIVRTDMSSKEFVDLMFETYDFDFLDKRNFKLKLTEKIDDLKRYIKEYEKKDAENNIYKFWIGDYKKDIKNIGLILSKLDKMDKEELLHAILSYDGINYNIVLDKVQLSMWTTMWNGPESMGSMMERLLACFTFYEKQVHCEVTNE